MTDCDTTVKDFPGLVGYHSFTAGEKAQLF